MKTRIYSRQVAKSPSSESFFTFAPLRLCARYSNFRLRLCRARFLAVKTCLRYCLNHLKPVQRLRILIQHLLALIVGHTMQRSLDELPRVGISRCDMRVVGLPHDIFQADIVSKRDAGLLIPEIHVDLPADQLARALLQSVAPELSPLPFVIAGGLDAAN